MAKTDGSGLPAGERAEGEEGTGGAGFSAPGLPVIFCSFLLGLIFLKIIFITANWSVFRHEELVHIARALWFGLRFDISILSYIFLPGLLFYPALVLTEWRVFKYLCVGYASGITLLVLLVWCADIQYFEEAGKHFTYEPFSYNATSLLPVIAGAFNLHPWLSALSVLLSCGCSGAAGLAIGGYLDKSATGYPRAKLPLFLACLCYAALFIIGGRGGPQGEPVKIADACISPSPYLNAVCLNPIFSIFRSNDSLSKELLFYNEKHNIRVVRDLLGIRNPESETYPLLRTSPGEEKGSGKNVVIILLESWTGKDVGALGGNQGLTPSFDDLSRRGILFTNFFATGVRTAEGLFSTFCSFPNQPLVPVMKRPVAYQTHWRSISQILEEAGYATLFVHGRDLAFDNMDRFLRYIHFQTIIDRTAFPAARGKEASSWPGYNDEEVMRRADEEFAKQAGRPFLGVIYTMNTHPPFMTPDNFPKVSTDGSISGRYFNALKYSDHTLETFFTLAKSRPYFKDTIFMILADHTRTRDEFTYNDQHRIPLLIYSPGQVNPGIDSKVSSQLDLLPTVLGLLRLKTKHASWGRDLLANPSGTEFAVSVCGNDVRWRDSRFLLNDTLADGPMLLFDIVRDQNCKKDVWPRYEAEGLRLKENIRSYVALSQTLMNQNRVWPK